jgi:hypothetical protein
MATTNTQSFAGEVKVTSNLTVDTNTLHVDSITSRVGVGKTDPGYTVDVNGTLNATALYVGGSEFTGGGAWTESGSDIYYTGGNVGIGTTDPQKTLEVAGQMRITNGASGTCDISHIIHPIHQAKITHPSLAQSDYFGSSVSISGDGSYAIAGAWGDEFNTGSAHIYVRSGSTWSHQAQITHPDAALYDRFGRSVSISADGSYALVGVERDDDVSPDSGSALIFRRSTPTSWSYEAKITAPDPEGQGSFGSAVSISSDGSYALVGAYEENSGAGSAHIYVRGGSTWTHQAEITHPSPALSGDKFGKSVSISGDGSYALVGAYAHNDDKGSAQIYVRDVSTWTHQAEITHPDPAPYDHFGSDVSISSDGSYALVGANIDNAPAHNTGSAHIFVRDGSTWSHQAQITHPDPTTGDNFGWATSISGDGNTFIVGAFGDRNFAGSALIYRRSTATSWSYAGLLTAPAPDELAQDRFGFSVSISSDGSYAAVGVIYDDGPAGQPETAAGSAHIYNLSSSLGVSVPIIADGTLLSFTGQHICFPEGPMEQGLVVSANKNKYVSLNGPLETDVLAIRSSESLPVVSLSNVANDRTAFGVVDHFEQSGTTRTQDSGATITRQNKEMGDNRVIVNSLGEGAIWIANTNGNVASGDLLTTSHLPGYAQRQDDDILTNYTVAKSTMDCDFGPEQVPARIVLKDEDGNNVLDSYGRLQWVDDPERTVSKYKIRYLDVSGTPTDEANAVHRAAFVGCTYHCG